MWHSSQREKCHRTVCMQLPLGAEVWVIFKTFFMFLVLFDLFFPL